MAPRLRRCTGPALLGLVLASVAAVTLPTAPAAQAAPALLSVPGTPSGDTVVSAQADPIGAPYLQVVVWLPDHHGDTTSIDTGIATDPVANDGTPQSLTVPTWGLQHPAVSFTLRGCATAAAASCDAQLDTQTRPVSQTVRATGIVEKPANPVFLPEEEILVSATNEGGGRMVARMGITREQPLTSTATAFAAYPQGSNVEILEVVRCSALSELPRYCEPPVSQTWVEFVSTTLPLSIDRPSRDAVSMNPDWFSSVVTTRYRTAAVAPRATWSLEDVDGTELIAPQDPATTYPGGGRIAFAPIDFLPDGLEDGTYTLRVDAEIIKGGLTRTATAMMPVVVVNDPPTSVPGHTVNSRVWREPFQRPSQHRHPFFEVDGYAGTEVARKATLVLRNRRGDVALTQPLTNGCGDWPACTADFVWRVDFRDLASQRLPAGVYAVELTAPDKWGRDVTIDLGTVDRQRIASVSREITVPAARALERATPKARYYSLRVPKLRGDLYGLDHVGLAAWTADTSHRGRIAARVPAVLNRWSRDVLGPRGAAAVSLPTRPATLGRTVEVRVSGNVRWTQLRELSVTVRGSAWRSTR